MLRGTRKEESLIFGWWGSISAERSVCCFWCRWAVPENGGKVGTGRGGTAGKNWFNCAIWLGDWSVIVIRSRVIVTGRVLHE